MINRRVVLRSRPVEVPAPTDFGVTACGMMVGYNHHDRPPALWPHLVDPIAAHTDIG